MNISIVIPVYNEEQFIEEIIKRVNAVDIKKEIIVVNDGSTDSTKLKLENINLKNLKIINNDINKGKGYAIKTGLKYVRNDIVIIQDADLEYDPSDYPSLIKPFNIRKKIVVFGSRFLGKKTFDLKKSLNHNFRYFINKGLTYLFNILNNQSITDAHTCYKVFPKEIISKLNLSEDGFSFCPEFSTKAVKLGYEIFEVPISYISRSRLEGKKITYKDGFLVVKSLFKYRLFD